MIMLAAAQYATSSELCVRVVDPGNSALGGATVKIVSLSGEHPPEQMITDLGRGQSCFRGIKEGHYRVEAWMEGFLHATFQPVVVQPMATNTFTIRLPFGEIREGGVHSTALFIGTLRENQGQGETVRSASICVYGSPTTTKPLSCFDTDELGEYRFSLDPGTYWIEVRKEAKRSSRFRLQVRTGEYRNAIRVAWRE
jgi:hypothetical protein